MADQNPSTLAIAKQNLSEYVRLMLGDQIIDIEPDPAHYEAAYQRTIGIYRQRAQNAYEESYVFLELQEDVNVYTLPYFWNYKKMSTSIPCHKKYRLCARYSAAP